jgi:hypothetical protein
VLYTARMHTCHAQFSLQANMYECAWWLERIAIKGRVEQPGDALFTPKEVVSLADSYG